MLPRIAAALTLALATVPAVAGQPCPNARAVPTNAHAAADILKTAAAAGQFKTLLSLLIAADLDDALKGAGPFVVFAPTDDAFAKLPKGTLETLLKPEGKATLQAILKLHVVPAAREVDYADRRPREVATLNGAKVTIRGAGDQFTVNGAAITARNIACRNGSVQVIDAVLLPAAAAKNTIPAAAEKAGTFKTLLAALTAVELAETLNGDGPFTVFAPTDEAFAKLPKGTVENLLKPENRKALVSILTYHVVPGKVTAKKAVTAGTAKTLQGGTVTIDIVDGRLTVNKAVVLKTDVPADNGVIHVIDRVLMPSH